MALKLNERYPGRFNNPNSDYPQGSFKNRTSPTSEDGSYFEQAWANDQLAFLSSILAGAGVTANGQIDKVGASQYYNALLQIIAGSATPPDATTVVKGILRLATQPEVDAGANDATAVTPLKLKQWMANQLYRAEFPISPGTSNSISYPSGFVAQGFETRLKCTGTAGAAGYSVGDEVDSSAWILNSSSTTNNFGSYLHSFSSTGCILSQANGTAWFLPNKSTGAISQITLASFSIVVRMKT